jgi:hypothetical protein
MANLLSINGSLRLMHYVPDRVGERSAGYEPIDIGKPLVIRYLSFFIRHEDETGHDEIMISTYIKTAEEKAGAAEAINYFNPETEFNKHTFRLNDFGGRHYGHELCYYTKSYLGESIRLTTRIMEIDSVDKKLVSAIKSGVSSIAGLPTFTSFLPFAAMLNAGISGFSKVVGFLNTDDRIVGGHDMDLHFRRCHARRLQSGRILCVPNKPDNQFLGNYKLTADNRLVTADDREQEYTDSSYYVIQINSEHNALYEDFDYFQRSAELIEMTNRGGNPQEFVDALLSSFKAYNDIESIRKIEGLAFEDNQEAKSRISALYKLMSPDVQRLYQERVAGLVKEGSV